MKKSKTHFALAIDKDREHVLNIVFQAAIQDPGAMSYFIHNNLVSCLMDLTDEFSKSVHKMNWCQDPDCVHENHEK